MEGTRSGRSTLAGALAALALGAMVFALSELPAQAPPPPLARGPGGIVAIVNQDVVTQGELDRRVNIEMESYGRRAGVDLASLDRERPLFERKVLDVIFEERLLLQDASRNDITASEEEIDREIREELKRDEFGVKLQDPDELYRLLKEKYGYSKEEYRARVRDEIKVTKLLYGKYFHEYFPPPGELREYYRSHAREFEQPSEVTFLMLVIDDVEDAIPKLEAIDKLLGKTSFEEVARQLYGHEDKCRWTKNLDDLKTWVYPMPEILARMEPGEVKKRIRVHNGWRYIKMVSVKPGKRRSFEEAQSDIGRAIQNNYRREEKERVVERLRKEAFIQDFLPKAPFVPASTPVSTDAGSGDKVKDVSPDPTVKPRPGGEATKDAPKPSE